MTFLPRSWLWLLLLTGSVEAKQGHSRAPSDVVRWPREGVFYEHHHFDALAVDADRLGIAFPAVGVPGPSGLVSAVGVVQLWELDGSGHWRWSQVLIPPAIPSLVGLDDNLDMNAGLLVVSSRALTVAAAYIYRRQGGEYHWEGSIARPGQGDGFGGSVAVISATKIAIGAPLAGAVVGGREGRVHVFERQGSSWVETQDLAPILTLSAFEHLGSRMQASDGLLAVGAPYVALPSTFTNIGKVYVYRDAPGGLVLEAMLEGPANGNPWDSNDFGHSFAISARWLAVGRSFDFTSRAGEVMFYVNDPTQGWIWHSTVFAPQPLVGDAFGKTVEWAGERLIVSAHGGTCDGETSAVHVFELDAGATWRAVECLAPANDPGALDSITFGDAIAAQGDRVIVSDSWNAQWGTASSGPVPRGCAFAYELTSHEPVCMGGTPLPGGSAARLDVVGDRSAASPSLRAILSNAPEPMLAVFLAARTFGPAVPLGGGTLCLQPPLFSVGQALVDDVGHAISAPIAMALPLVPGETWFLQAWHRLPTGTGFTSATSAALRVTIE